MNERVQTCSVRLVRHPHGSSVTPLGPQAKSRPQIFRRRNLRQARAGQGNNIRENDLHRVVPGAVAKPAPRSIGQAAGTSNLPAAQDGSAAGPGRPTLSMYRRAFNILDENHSGRLEQE